MHIPKTVTYAAAAALAVAVVAVPMVVADNDDSDRVDDLLRTIKRARIIDLSHTWDKNSPIASVNPSYSFALDATHAGTRGMFGDEGQLSFTSEVMHFSGQHGAPNIDAIGHIGRDGKLFGGIDAAKCDECDFVTAVCDARRRGEVEAMEFPTGCFPLIHDGEVCLDALLAAGCDEYGDYVADQGAIVPTECNFCPPRDAGRTPWRC